MNRLRSKSDWLRDRRVWGAAALLAFTVYLAAGVARIPFHPDESSSLFQSRDFEQYLSDPRLLARSPGAPLDAEEQYRALNPPLPKYLLGLGRRLAGFGVDTVAVDWDWSESWAANLDRGALPPQGALNGARLASTLMLPIALLLLWFTGRKLTGPGTGVLAAALLGVNALFLLHGRRAMMEGVLLAGECLALWAIMSADRRPWLAGGAVALAISAKHSLIPLAALGLLGAVWVVDGNRRLPAALSNAAQYLATAAVVVLLLTPFLWSDPIAAGAEILQARSSLAEDQVQSQIVAEHSAYELPMSASDRTAAFLGQVFFAPVQFLEAENYRTDLAGQIESYLLTPGTNWLRGWVAGGIVFGLTLAGLSMAAVSLRRLPAEFSRYTALLLLGTLAMAGALLAAIPFPFQRYYLPMLPLTSIWAALAIVQLYRLSKGLSSSRTARD